MLPSLLDINVAVESGLVVVESNVLDNLLAIPAGVEAVVEIDNGAPGQGLMGFVHSCYPYDRMYLPQHHLVTYQESPQRII